MVDVRKVVTSHLTLRISGLNVGSEREERHLVLTPNANSTLTFDLIVSTEAVTFIKIR